MLLFVSKGEREKLILKKNPFHSIEMDFPPPAPPRLHFCQCFSKAFI